MLDAGKIPMVSGYFGRNVDGKLMTLGRGGSDLTAAVMGYALDADEINLFVAACVASAVAYFGATT